MGMKLSNRQKEHSRLELSMTSMIDVVFLLLIFFLVTTSFVKPEKQVGSNIKVEDKGASEVTDLEPAIVKLEMKSGAVKYRLGAIESFEFEDIDRVLQSFDGKENGAFVHVGDEVPFGAAAQVIGACREHGFSSVSFLPLQ